ncbi:MAG TPA: hypothetical protein VF322_06780 [Gammaproteobacteria bacterium]
MTLPRRSVAAAVLLLAAGFGLDGCETQGPFEEAGEEIDEAVDEVEDARDGR